MAALSLRSRWRAVLWTLAAAALFLAAAFALCSDVWDGDLRRVVPTQRLAYEVRQLRRDRPLNLIQSDQRFVVWATSNAAERLATDPLRLFDARPCHPAKNALAYGHPLISFGLLGLPVWIATGDPILTYNAAFAAVLLLGALAMFFLVRDWTGVPAAGIAAGLIYAFATAKVALVYWPFMFDTGWTLLALFFVRRFFARGRWVDGIGAAVCCVLQMAVSLYPVLATVFMTVPLLVWLFVAYGTAQLRPAPALVSLAILAIGASAIYGPYLGVRDAHETLHSSTQIFAPWSTFLPGGVLSWSATGLALVGLALPARKTVPGLGGDPRWALLGAAVLVAVLATGGNQLAQAEAHRAGEDVFAIPSLYGALAAIVPGLDAVRLPGAMGHGVLLAASVLAGLGVAGLVRLTPERYTVLASVIFVAASYVTVVRPTALGLSPRIHYAKLELRPAEDDLRFYQTLHDLGNEGPLLELPMNIRWPVYSTEIASRQMLLTSYHGRRTSGCYNSYGPPTLAEVDATARGLPRADALEALRAMGFTTIVVHAGDTKSPTRVAVALARVARMPGTGIRTLHSDGARTAYAIDP